MAGFDARGGEVREAFRRESVADGDWRSRLDSSFSPDAIAHRIVRGRKTDTPAEPYTQAVRDEIAATQDLAPTHDPHALALIEQTCGSFPQAAQIVVYDTAFHATISAEYATYAIPQRWRAAGMRRIGYHGLSCAYAARWLAEHAGGPLRAVHAHLGNGCSVTAMREGRSIATTMGYTPLEGVVMGTRSGSIDPGVLLQLQRDGSGTQELCAALFRESGLLALCGTNDMREVESRRARGDGTAALAFDVFIASVSSAVAAMAAAVSGIDALTFAGGIGLNSHAVRDAVCRKLQWMLGDARVYAIDVQEELVMALAALEMRAPV